MKVILADNVKVNVVLDAIWFPVVCPETYPYTLSACIASGLPAIAFDFGAIGRRLTGRENYIPVPIECMLNPASIIEYLLIDKEVLESQPIEHQYPSIIKDYYQIELK